jgi:dipeptidyl aminopeptidase/acylaminoacyl peptidase
MKNMFGLVTLLISSLFAEDPAMKEAPYGSWKSPITAEVVASGALQFQQVKLGKDKLYWLEGRLMSWNAKTGEKEVLPKEYSVRTRAHEYGGGALLIAGDEIFFINDKDQQIYWLHANGNIEKITSMEKTRFADGAYNSKDHSLYYVMEEHGTHVVNSIVKIDLKTKKIDTVASGNDFYSNPRISPDGNALAYLTWNLPYMPWDGTELWVINLKDQTKKLIAGSSSISIADPKWSPSGKLYYISDRSNWWNIYQDNPSKPVVAMDAEFASPQWNFDASLMGFSHDHIICSYIETGGNKCARISLSGELKQLTLPYTAIKSVAVNEDQLAFIGSSPDTPGSIILYNLKTGQSQIIKRSRKELFDPGFISHPQMISYPTSQGQVSHAFYYPPTNPHFKGLPGEKPPLLVESHGGPTAQSFPGFSPGILYWTSRGFGVVVVNYRGSTGYGRKYRDSLNGQWGIFDVDDCTEAALYCVKQGLADPKRLAIEGGSAGGFTTLAALAFRNVFQVGADYFGVSDLEGLALDTHKFESRYLDQLVGPYPKEKALYAERSPLYNIDKINCPVIIFQGDEDAIVPPSQSEKMYESLKKRKIPTAYLLFKGEQHGFRKAENIQRALEAQLYFFSKILKFPLGEKIEPVDIVNLKAD